MVAGLSLMIVVAGSYAFAEEAGKGISEVERLTRVSPGAGTAAADDGGIIRTTPDKTKLVHLDQDAASVIVTNPANVSVVLDSPRLLVVMPRAPGATSFTVLDSKGGVIMEKTVIVAMSAQPKYVRVRRACASGDSSCVPTAYFYCPDGCYEVLPVPGDSGGGQVPEIPASAPTAGPGLDATGLKGMNNPIGIDVTHGSENAPYYAPPQQEPPQ